MLTRALVSDLVLVLLKKTNFGFAIAFLALAGFAPAQALYVVSNDNDTVLKYNVFTGGAPVALLGVFTSGDTLDEPKGLRFGPAGNQHVASSGTPAHIERFNGANGAFIDNFVPTGSGLSAPTGLILGHLPAPEDCANRKA